MKKIIIGFAIVAALILVFVFKGGQKVTTIEGNRVLSGDYVVGEKEKLLVRGGSEITIDGNLAVKGTIDCENGPITLVVRGNTHIDHMVQCERVHAEAKEGEAFQGVTIITSGSFTLGPKAEIVSNGNIQIVSSGENIAKTKNEVEVLYEEAAHIGTSGHGIGPIVSDGEGVSAEEPAVSAVENGLVHPRPKRPRFSFLKKAEAHVPVTVTLMGRIRLEIPPKGVKQIVLIDVPDATEVRLADLELDGPDGRAGEDDRGSSCNAKGGKGEDAFRMLVRAPNLKVKNVTLNLGDGGKGGDAETKKDCKPGIAMGGQGGSPSNFKMIGDDSFVIEGDFIIYPGKGGVGGIAIASGKDGGPNEDGGDAKATGGDGGHNNKSLAVTGTVGGVQNVQIGSVIGGDGGNTTANPGKGGDGGGCGKKGGNGGNGTATGGKGGNASLGATAGAQRTVDADDKGGKGGDANSHGAKGGEGGDCDSKGPGGNGGKGGNADTKEGKGGKSTVDGSDGVKKDETGGDGGMGGDGCKEGKGGKGGKGNPLGKDGADGKNLCVVTDEKKTMTTPPTTPPTQVTPPSLSTPPPSSESSKKIKVIGYQGKYLPVDQLIIEDEVGCGADHWHAAEGVVKATDGSFVPDPGPQCGYCKVSQCPVMEMEVRQ